MPVFDHLEILPDDPILGLSERFQRDERAGKIDLGVGIYKDPAGSTPVMAAVKQAEAWLVAHEPSKAYLSTAGVPGFEAAIVPVALGEEARSAIGLRHAAVQTPGGTGALRLMGEFLVRSGVKRVLVGVPTWPIHAAIFERAGLAVTTCRHLTPEGGFDLDALLSGIAAMDAGDAVLLHACCHNPTGIDPTAEEWQAILAAVKARHLLPLFDMAYQGFGDGLEEDAWALRLFCRELPEVLASVSCSKNFGLYRERTGALLASCADRRTLAAVKSQIIDSARCLWSMPPAHGGAVVTHILGDPDLRANWQAELEAMRQRIVALRTGLCEALQVADAFEPLRHLARQKGMFSSLGCSAEAVQRLREECAVYLVGGGRINVSGLVEARFAEVAAAFAKGLAR